MKKILIITLAIGFLFSGMSFAGEIKDTYDNNNCNDQYIDKTFVF